ncbi:hypothetical protein [Deinococcus yavapaiensis]|uniref:Streptogramin lyase n=1 Tax=Deinococcus yavapaiensis KR-236 TaxID=694435 RepID=A0A318S135_9DEIO|nr:hypothetical protein [Deinococcus yavapaiensis]PYE49486.1 hypothetical protein DES52_12232 [Deinococcus yavapaiensis KR-236]
MKRLLLQRLTTALTVPLALAACGSNPTASTPGFTVNLVTLNAAATQGVPVQSQAIIKATGGFNGAVTASLVDPPLGVTLTADPVQVNSADAYLRLTLNVTNDTPLFTKVKVRFSGQGVTQERDVQFVSQPSFTPPGLQAAVRIEKLLRAPDGTLWLSAGQHQVESNAIFRFDPAARTWRTYRLLQQASSFTDTDTYDFLIAPDGMIWAVVQDPVALLRLNPTNGAVDIFTPEDNANLLTSISRASNGHLWIKRQNNTFTEFDPASLEFKEYTVPDAQLTSRSTMDAQDNLWFMQFPSNPALVQFNTTTKTFKKFPIGGTDMPYSSVDAKDHVWYVDSRTNTLGVLDPSTGTIDQRLLPKSFKGGDFKLDPFGGMWTLQEGALKLFDLEEDRLLSLPTVGNALSLEFAPNGDIWYVNSDGRLVSFPLE